VGHYTSARIFGVTVREFAVGMGPRILSHVSKKTNIRYSLRALPIGGFVNMVGEDEESETLDNGSITNKPVWQKLIVTSSGAVMNILLGIILMLIVVLLSQNLGSTTIITFNGENASSSESGLAAGDKIVKIGGAAVHIAPDLVYEIMRQGDKPLDIVVERGGKKITVPQVIFPQSVSEGITFGSVDFRVYGLEKNALNIGKYTVFQSISSLKMIWQSFFDLIIGKYGFEQMSGPVGITSAISEAKESGGPNLLYLCAIITFNLGIVNLLPLPALDGGRLIFQLIELVRRKPINPVYEGYVHFVGIVLLMVLMVLVTYQDIVKIFAG
jgi:regulator of sigma E protease